MPQFPFDTPADILLMPCDEVRESRWTEALECATSFINVVTDGRRAMDNAGENLLRLGEFARYTGEVANGGHGQYLDNGRPSIETLKKLERDIQALGAPDYAAIFADFVRTIQSLPAGKDHRDGTFTGCDIMEPFDRRYFALWYSDPIEKHMVRFLEAQPWVKLVTRKEIEASSRAFENLRQMKKIVTPPSAEGVAQFVEFTKRALNFRFGGK